MSDLLRELSRARLLLAVAAGSGLFALIALVLLIAGLTVAGMFIALLGVQLAVLGSALVLHRALLRGGRNQPSAAELAALQGSSDSARLSQAIHALRQEFSVQDASAQRLDTLLRRQDASRQHLRRDLFDEYFGTEPGGGGSWSVVSENGQRSTV